MLTAAKRFFRKTLQAAHTQEPRVINVDKNAAYSKAIDEMKVERVYFLYHSKGLDECV